MRHPNEAQLALYAGGDLGWWARQQVELHLRSCGPCQQDVTEFSSQRALMNYVGPDVELNWNNLAAEMKANIRLGLEAGSCVGPRPASRPVPNRWMWIPVATAAAVLFAAGGGFWLNRAHPVRPAGRASATQVVEPEQVIFEAKDSGIQVRDGEEVVSQLGNRSRGSVVYSVSAQGGIGASYVDRDTGMVTVNNIYGQ